MIIRYHENRVKSILFYYKNVNKKAFVTVPLDKIIPVTYKYHVSKNIGFYPVDLGGSFL